MKFNLQSRIYRRLVWKDAYGLPFLFFKYVLLSAMLLHFAPSFVALAAAIFTGGTVPVAVGSPKLIGSLVSSSVWVYTGLAIVWCLVWVRLAFVSTSRLYWGILFALTWLIFTGNTWNIETPARLLMFHGLFTFAVLGERHPIERPENALWAGTFRLWIIAQVLISIFFAGLERITTGGLAGEGMAVLLNAPPDWLVRELWVSAGVFSRGGAQAIEIAVIVFEICWPVFFIIRQTRVVSLVLLALYLGAVVLFLETAPLYLLTYLASFAFLLSFTGSRSGLPARA